MTAEETDELLYTWPIWARPEQLPPEGDWSVWLVLAGRGFGKTRLGAEYIRSRVAEGVHRVALIAETAADARDVMVEGPSGILAVSPPWNRPTYEPSKRRLTWPNGSIATTYSGDSPDQLRGPEHSICWADEPAKWSYPDDAWSNMEMGLRRGVQPRVVATTTPRPIPLIRALVADPGCHVTRGNTYDNLVNLPLPFIKRVLKKYEGTRLGRQELYAEILDDVLGALWNRELLERTRVKQAPGLQKIAVGVDPMGKDPDEDDDTGLSEVGIVVAGLGHNGEGYVLEDLSGPYSPNAWATVSVEAYRRWGANWIVAEKNFGGAMVASTIRTVDNKVNVQMAWASQGKAIRAEPIVSLYEQGRCHHVGMFPELEDEQCTWTDDSRQPSPNRMDAEVWALTKLMLDDDDEPHFDRQRHTYTPAATATKAYIIDPKRVYAWKQAIEQGRRVPAYGPEDYEPLRRVFVAYLEEYQRTKDYRGALVAEQYAVLREKMGDIKA
uniref:Putative terminase n=1 Tax=viral metagenome TaxID=1070528 RepID=A0A6H1ZAG4_9ZZZZ